MYLAEKLQACEAKCKQTNISHRRGSLLRFPWPRRALRVTGKPFPASPRSRGAPSPPTRGNLAPPRPTQTPLRHARNNRRVNNHFHSRLHHNFAAVLYRARATHQDFFFIFLYLIWKVYWSVSTILWSFLDGHSLCLLVIYLQCS